MQNLISVLTEKQMADVKRTCAIIFADNAKQGREWIAKGLNVIKSNSRTYYINYASIVELHDFLNKHDEAVSIVSIQGKYSDNNGAYEVMTAADCNGVEWNVSNMYDPAACFRTMTIEQQLAYATKGN